MSRCHPAIISAVAIAMALSACTEPTLVVPSQLVIYTDTTDARVSPTRAATVTASVIRHHVPETVVITATGMPSGVTATLGQATHDPNLSTVPITFTSSIAAAPGLYPVTITASAPGAVAVSTEVKLRVADQVRVSTAACAPGDQPLWFAAQDGNGALLELQPIGNEYRFTPDEDHAGYYYVIAQADSFATFGVLDASEALLEAPISLCDAPTASAPTMFGSIIGSVELERTRVMLGGEAVTRRGDGSFEVTGGPGTTENLIAIKFGFLPGTPNRILIRRDVLVKTGNLGTLDLHAGGPETYVPQSALMAFNDLPQTVRSDLSFHSGPACTGVDLYRDLHMSSGSPSNHRRYWGLPPSAMQPDEWYRLTVGGHFPRRLVTVWTREVMPLDIELRPEPISPEVTRVAGRGGMQYQLDIPPAYDRSAVLTHTTWRPQAHHVEITASRAWLAAENDIVTTPDFSATPGWNSAWEPDFVTGHVHWTVKLIGGPGGAPCTAGVHEWTVDFWGHSWPN